MSNWAIIHIDGLKHGKTVSFRPTGGSMKGLIESGELCTVEPIGQRALQVGDIVLCKVNGNQYLHLITHERSEQAGNHTGR